MSPKSRTRVAPTARQAKSSLRSGGAATRGPAPTETRLRKLIEEATVDCYNEAKELTGLLTMIQEHLQVPFETTVLGATVMVERVDFNKADEIVAFCRRGRERQAIPVVDLPLPSPPPRGAEWIAAYRRWRRRG